jgi:hypothetical protein
LKGGDTWTAMVDWMLARASVHDPLARPVRP